MVANSDKPLNAKDHVEKLVAHQHDASTLSRDVHHASFDKQREAQQAAFKGNEAQEKPKTKSVDLSEANVDQYGHVISGKIKLPGGDTYESTDGGKTWVWNTVKDGQPAQFKINGFKDATLDSEGNFTMRFKDGRKHIVDSNGKYTDVIDTVKVTFKDGRQPEFLPADEATQYTAPNALLDGVAQIEKIKRDRYGTIESITTDKDGTVSLEYETNENSDSFLTKITYGDGSKMQKTADGKWQHLDKDGKSELFDGDVAVDHDNATFEFRKRPQFSQEMANVEDALPPGFVMPRGYDTLYGEAQKRGRSANFWQNASIIAETAKAKGVPAEHALATALVETGGTLSETIRGDHGYSYGLFQLYTKGGQGNELLNKHNGDRSVLVDPALNADVSIGHMARTISKHGNGGRSMAQLMALSQRPADPVGYARAVESRLNEARSILNAVDRIAQEKATTDRIDT